MNSIASFSASLVDLAFLLGRAVSSVVSDVPELPERLTTWLPQQAADSAPMVDWLFNFIFGVCLFFFVLIVVLTTYFTFRYRERPGQREAPESPSHNVKLEVFWTVIPTILVMFIFYWGFTGYMTLETVPKNSLEVRVDAQKWSWTFTYPNGAVTDQLYVPVDTNVKLLMTASDVIHSFFVPAFRVKKDVVPGRYHSLWFRANKLGDFRVYCTEYCGTQHSDMTSWVRVLSSADYEAKLADLNAPASPVEAGARLFKIMGCGACHTTDGSKGTGIGPTLLGVMGHEQALADGTKITVDEAYIRESLLYPMAKIVQGYAPAMPSFDGKLSDDDIANIIAFLKTLEDGK